MKSKRWRAWPANSSTLLSTSSDSVMDVFTFILLIITHVSSEQPEVAQMVIGSASGVIAYGYRVLTLADRLWFALESSRSSRTCFLIKNL